MRSNFIPFNNMAAYTSPGNPNLVGTPFQLSAIPGNLINRTAQKMMSYYPFPNVAVGTAAYSPYNNWAGTGSNLSDGNQLDLKIDRTFNGRTQAYARYSYNWGHGQTPMCWDNPLDPCSSGPVDSGATNIAVHVTHNFGPNKLLDLTYGFIRGGWYQPGVDKGLFPSFNPITALGLPAYMGDPHVDASPFAYVNGGYLYAGPNSIGQQGYEVSNDARQSHDLLGAFDYIVGRQEMKVGGEFRVLQQNGFGAGTAGGSFEFNQFGTSEDPSSGGGDGMATFLTGTSTSGHGQINIPMAPAATAHQFSAYFQDTWRTTTRLTVNLGLRYDIELPATERFNRQQYFDPTLASPLRVPGLPNLQGGDVFATPGQRGVIPDPYYREVQPRVGFAYRLRQNTVLRGGYGIFFNQYNFGPADDVGSGIDGFAPTTPWFTTYQGDGATPWAAISNPWPDNSLQLPTGNKLGALTNVGLTVTGAVPAWNKTPYTQTWNLGFEQLLPGNILWDTNYVGQKGTNLFVGGINGVNYLGPALEHMSSAQVTALESFVNNPFSGIITNPASSLASSQVVNWQLQLPFPQFTGMVLFEPPWANSIYHALQMRVEKRFSHGLELLANYTWSKSIDDSSVNSNNNTYLGGFTHIQDPNDLKLERGLSEFDVPQQFELSYVYQLPFGRGLRWGSKWNWAIDGFLGGWETSGIWDFNDGMPIHLSLNGCGTPLPSYGCQQPNLLAPLQESHAPGARLSQYFANPQVAVVPAAFTIGNGPADLPNLFSPGTQNADLALYKSFNLGGLREGMSLQLRVESINALNTAQMCAPNASVNSGLFGQTPCQANSPRVLQLGAKFYF